MKRIWVSKQSMRLPGVCACCLRSTRDVLELSRTKISWLGVVTVARTLTMRVPYCAECRSHVAWYQDLGIVGKALKTTFVALLGAALWALVVCAVAQELTVHHTVPRFAT